MFDQMSISLIYMLMILSMDASPSTDLLKGIDRMWLKQKLQINNFSCNIVLLAEKSSTMARNRRPTVAS
uniref:Secreted protein n=1 Tax=Romanomermis culicivorax TaxID=13658 RepID=A0A915JW74_ROMCU